MFPDCPLMAPFARKNTLTGKDKNTLTGKNKQTGKLLECTVSAVSNSWNLSGSDWQLGGPHTGDASVET